MNTNYSAEKNTLILVTLLKKHGIRKIIASPGTTNISFVASVQSDNFFQVYSVVDERSAAYIACGLAVESGEPVVLTCTGATASRNYVSALTEAFYRKIPVLAVTATQKLGKVGQYIPQVIDRSVQMKDIVRKSIQCPMVHSDEDEKITSVLINDAILELSKDGGGPVHINIETEYSNDFSKKELLPCRIINRYTVTDSLPKINFSKVAIFVGSHVPFSTELANAVDIFCEKYNGVVLVDHTSGYRGKYRIMFSLLCAQSKTYAEFTRPELLIHIGQVSGSYPRLKPQNVWRVNPDGAVRDTFSALENVFEMDEISFFSKYNDLVSKEKNTPHYFNEWQNELHLLRSKIIEENIPFSNIWVALKTSSLLPASCALHLSILNSLRSWNFFDVEDSISGYSNTGGFGIDGCMSSLIGASLANRNKLYFGVIGDLSFFYDMNSLGNHNIGKNIRIMLINNGVGTEFKNYNHRAAYFGDDADEFMAARGHFGNKSNSLVKHYAEDLGFKYISASSKQEFLNNVDQFVNSEIGDKSIIFEIFTDSLDESNALKYVSSLEKDATSSMKGIAKSILGEKGVSFVKHLL